MVEEGFRDEDWIKMPCEEGHDVISPPQITNIPSVPAALTIGLGEEETAIPKARRAGSPIQTEPVASVSVLSQSTCILPSSIKSKIVTADLKRIRNFYGIPNEYKLRVPNKREQEDWRSPGWVCFYEVAFVVGFIFPFPRLIREFFAHFGIFLC